ncbi:spore germination protein GerPB [Paenibacillus septentrionalis]|uniref:Spore germination protein GerPB n=1 Tax=Paenibacillus septentrionalis TaxID=429342 RepID=A0ABW1V4M7_9BACL
MFHVQQHIYIGTIRIDSINNSSMLQVGTSGGVNATSYVQGQTSESFSDWADSDVDYFSPSLVPLPNPN